MPTYRRIVSTPSFQALTIKFNGRSVNQIITDIMMFPAFDPKSNPVPPFAPYQTAALWDTGATGSVITTATANAMNLTPTGRTNFNHAGGAGETNTYLVNILFPNKVMVYGIRVIEGNDLIGNFGAIIGMDIISKGDFSITNEGGESWMSFRIPSTTHHDYVWEYYHTLCTKLPGNADCPCQSGKRVKNCHGVTHW